MYFFLNQAKQIVKKKKNVFIPLIIIIVIIIFNEGYVLYMEYVYFFVDIGST